ncbi:unnamed protein product [Clonostachys rosea]|uniref:Carrier domain-containing protein n=1 Tax=Bionectria ochroleuca TaxID=29856 RepID=A0ABY6UIK3_BIOOC|nr:unnamed protein product [Clonostachys rosea]
MASQLGNIPRDLDNGENAPKSLQNDVLVSKQDLMRIWQWNAIVPERIDVCVHDLISQSVHRQPEAPAVHAWDGGLTYRELDDLSTQLAHRLVSLGVGPNMFVPLCFEKSMWTAVAMLAVMKAGGASVGMDITQPEERLRTIVSQANPHVILASETHQVLAQRLANCTVVVVSNRNTKQSHPLSVLVFAGEPVRPSDTTLCGPKGRTIISYGPADTPTLVTFICLDTSFNDEESRNQTIRKMTAGIDKQLASKIPMYMIPTSYIPVDALPMTATGKTDRRKLREFGGLLTQRQLDSLTQSSRPSRPVSTDMERNLQALWALVLDIEATSINADDSFLRFGGDSVRAMQLVGMAREHGLSFSVADIFNHPRLESLASITKAKTTSHSDSETIPAFSLLKPHQSVEDVQTQAAAMCGVNVAEIQDIFPCTPLQEGLMALTGRRKGDYVASITLELDGMTDAERLRSAWEQVATAAPILRTRIVDIPQQGLVQVILDESVEWEIVDELETYLDDPRRKDMGLSTRLSRFGAAFDTSSSSPRYLVWTIHHALYDGWSMRLIMNALRNAYQMKPIPYLQPFQTFVKHLSDTEETTAVSFWRNQFAGLEAAQFPALPLTGYHPRPTSKLTSTIESLEWGSTGITGSNLVRAAWSILISNYTGSSDVIFGTTVAGRQNPIAGIEKIAAPTISTMPLRIVANPLETVGEIIAKVQKQAVDMIPFEHTGLQRIRQASADAQEACRFQTLIVVQPSDEDSERNTIFRPSTSSEDSNIEYNALLSYALVVECRLEAKGMRLDANFDENVIKSNRVSCLLQQFQYILQQICIQENGERRLQDVEVTNTQDLETIWNWNSQPSESINSCAHDLFLQVARRQPDAEAVRAWDGRLTYAQLDNYSNTLASHLVSVGIGPNVRVPLCLEKSTWMPVAMLAVMKAGGIAVGMDITQPEARLCTIAKQSKAKHILSSASAEALANHLGECLVITVCQETLSSLQRQVQTPLPIIKPSDALCTLFTSGSTGTPKGTTLTHSNFSTGIEQQIRAFGIQSSSRVYDFASYAFDFAWSNVLLPLSVGGSICIPSEEQRKNAIAESINQLGANFAFFTPSVARALDPNTLTNLTTLVVGGEAVQRNDFYDWPSRIKLFNIYGPSECTIMATYTDIRPGEENDGTIGKGAGTTTWVVQPSGHNLSPIGAVGELYLEGPLVGIGYLDDAERTANSFLENPLWLCRGGPGHLGRRSRVYRTGDLVRYNPDGSLVFVGRRDTQVKLRGQRIELQEVEHHVQSLLTTDNRNGVQIVAEVIEPEGSGNPTLVAFMHMTMNHSYLEAADKEAYRKAVRKMIDGIEDRLGEKVPIYMIPTAFIPLQSLPTTASGKTDRRRLRELGASMYSAHHVQATKNGYCPPSTELQSVLQRIWSEVLNIPLESIGIDAEFTRLGGDSISSMQVVSRCRAKNISITTSDILGSKSIEKLALCCKEVKPKSVIADASTEETLWHLSPIQQMFFDFHPQGLDHFNQSFMLKLKAPVSPDVLFAALQATVSRHPMLRARFWLDSSGCWQQLVVKDSQHAFAFEKHASCQRSEVHTIAKARQGSLSILSGPVFAADIFSIPGEQQSLLLTAHHLIIDLMSWRIIWHDIEQHIRAGDGSKLDPEPISFQAWSKVQSHTNWAKLTRHNLNLAVRQLANTEPAFTLSDFSLLSTTNLGLERLLRDRLLPIGVKSSDILDIYPCTPVQEGILLSKEKGAASYANFWVWNCIPSFHEDSVSPNRLEDAWKLVARQHSILSTIFVEQLDGGGFVQVLLSHPQCQVVRMDTLSTPPADALLKIESPAFSAGQPSHTFTIARNSDGQVACRLDISHLLIDASSLHALLKNLAKCYQGQSVERAPQFRSLVAHLRHQTRQEKLAFWTNSLFQAQPCRLVTAPGYKALVKIDRSSHGMITIPTEKAAGIDLFCRSKGITRSVFLQVAWSLVLSRYTGMSDVIFGYMASGRDAPIQYIESMIGPLINLLISRIDLKQSLDKILAKTSENSIEQLRFQHSSLADIQHALSMGSKKLFNTALTFFKHATGTSDEEATYFWRQQFLDPRGQMFPSPSRQSLSPSYTIGTQIHSIEGLPRHESPMSVLIEMSWAILAAKRTGSRDVIFGTAEQNMNSSKGLALAVPVRVVLDWANTLEEAVNKMRRQMEERRPFKNVGLECVRRASPNAEEACHFQTLLVMQWDDNDDQPSEDGDEPFAHLDSDYEKAISCPLEIRFAIQTQGVVLNFRFDSNVIDEAQVSRIAFQFEHILRQACDQTGRALARTLQDISTLSNQDVANIWRWNNTVPEASDTCISELISRTATRQPQATAICAWDGSLTYAQLDSISTRLAKHLITMGVTKGSIVPLCFEKSMYTPLAMLAVMKAGGASLAMDVSQPKERLCSIVEQVNPDIILSSVASEELARSLDRRASVVVESQFYRQTLHSVKMERRLSYTGLLSSQSSTLVAFVCVTNDNLNNEERKDKALQLAVTAIERYLVDRLPTYMVPAAFIPLDSFPMTATGKTDRLKLRELGASMYDKYTSIQKFHHSHVSASTDLQQTIVEVWAEVLNVPFDKISIDAPFLSLGGDSIAAMQVVSRCRARDISVTVGDVLRSKTIENLAGLCKTMPVKDGHIVPEESPEDQAWLPSPIQQLFFDAHPHGLNHFNQSFVLRLTEPIPGAAVRAALDTVVRCHPMLRARFRQRDDGQWEQVISDPAAEPFAFKHHSEVEKTGVRTLAKARKESLNIFDGPVFAADLFSVIGEDQSLLLTAHHLVVDLVSWRVIWQNIEQHIRTGSAPSQESVSFQKWCRLQRERSSSLSPSKALPVPASTSDFSYWGTTYSGLDLLFNEQLSAMGISIEDVQDIYPCTPVQEGILLSRTKAAASYANFWVWECCLGNGNSSNAVAFSRRLETMWRAVVSQHPILSTVFIEDVGNGGFIQVVLRNSPARVIHLQPKTASASAAETLLQMERPCFSSREPECQFTISRGANEELACRVDISHTLMDATSMKLLLQDLNRALSGHNALAAPPFRDLVQHLSNVSKSERLSFWLAYLTDVEPCELPVHGPSGDPNDELRSRSYGMLKLPAQATTGIAALCRHYGITRSVFLQIVWAFVLSQCTGKHEVCFAYMASGRDAPIIGIERMVGPLINMLISRVDVRKPLSDILSKAAEDTIEHLKFQHNSLAEIQHQMQLGSRQLFNTALTVHDSSSSNGQTDMFFAGVNEESATQFWQTYLCNSEAQSFPIRSGISVEGTSHPQLHSFDHAIRKIRWNDLDASPTYLIYLAWAVLVARYTESNEVIFGSPIPPRISSPGKTVLSSPDTVLPVRLVLDWEATVKESLDTVRTVSEDVATFGRVGIQRIRTITRGEHTAAASQMVLEVVQPGEASRLVRRSEENKDLSLRLEFRLEHDGLRLDISSHKAAIDHGQAKRMALQFEHILRQICSSQKEGQRLGGIETISDQDLRDIWRWNSTMPEPFDVCVHELIAEVVRLRPNAPAICACDGDLTYKQLDELSDRLCYRLVQLGLDIGQVVPICIEKSKWASVAILAVMKAGGVGLTLDVTQPKARLEAIVRQVHPMIMISSAANELLAHELRSDATTVAVLPSDIDLCGPDAHAINVYGPAECTPCSTMGDLKKDGPVIGSSNSTLAVFVGQNPYETSVIDEDSWAKNVMRMTADIEKRLADRVPYYMVPTAYIPLRSIPITGTGKTNRKRLQELGKELTLQQLSSLTSASTRLRPVETELQRQLQVLWATVLAVDSNIIGLESNFMRIGGDSISAMQLVGAGHEQGLSFSVADLFRYPRLEEFATIVKIDGIETTGMDTIPAFSLLNCDMTEPLKTEVAGLCSVNAMDIEDVLPCTPLQQGLMALTAKRAGDYVATIVRKIPKYVNHERLHKAWKQIVATTPILRTRLTDLPGHGIVQVVVNEELDWATSNDFNLYLEDGRQREMVLGARLSKFAIASAQDSSQHYLVWTIHHALYDGWSMQLIFDAVKRAYQSDASNSPMMAFTPMIKHVTNLDGNAVTEFWGKQFAGSEGHLFPALPTASFHPKCTNRFSSSLENLHWGSNDITAANIIRTTWAILVSGYTGSNDVVFGATVTGRQTPLIGIERMAGPTIATVPVRVILDPEETLGTNLYNVQMQAVDMIPFEQTGLQRISHVSLEAREASHFQTLLVVQPVEEDNKGCSLFQAAEDTPEDGDSSIEHNSTLTHALVVECCLEAAGARFHFNYDPKIICQARVHQISGQLQHLIRQVLADGNRSKSLNSLDIVSKHDLSKIWAWNSTLTDYNYISVPDLLMNAPHYNADALAIDAWDGKLSYSDLDKLSTRLARHLISLGVHANMLVPLCFEKSAWTPVAMLAVIKAGSAAVGMDVTQPETRLQSIVQQTQAVILLSSAKNEELARRLSDKCRIVVVSEASLGLLGSQPRTELPRVDPSDALCAIFTSGSTGMPKGVVLSHQNFATAIPHHAETFDLKPTSRVYDFASYAFDFSWSNLLLTLYSGGCICIPSEDERRNEVTQSIQRFNANFAFFTPSVARILDPAALPTLDTLVVGGEALSRTDFVSWPDRMRIISPMDEQSCNQAVWRATAGVEERLANKIPIYMIPTAYIPMRIIPMTATGKTDRRKLRELATELNQRQQLTTVGFTRDSVLPMETEMERQLQQLWADVLRINADSISADDSFLRIGGDSVGVMKLVAAARQQNLSISVADVFRHPRLRELAKHIELEDSVTEEHILAFSLLKPGTVENKLRADVAALCRVSLDEVEDVLPCTPLQEGLLVLTARRPGDYVATVVLELQENIDLGLFRQSWQQVVAATPILRTRVVDLPGQGFVQAVLREAADFALVDNLDSYLGKNSGQQMGVGTRLCQLAVANGQDDGRRHFILIIHHALYDGWSLKLIFKAAQHLYMKAALPTMIPFASMVKHIAGIDQESAMAYWKEEFLDSGASQFPVLPSATYHPHSINQLSLAIKNLEWVGSDFTASNLIRTAWSILVASYTGDADVVFGAVVTGRQASVSGIEHIVGPTIATVPVRVPVNRQLSLRQILDTVQTKAVNMIPFEQTGLQRIRQASLEAEEACRFQTLLVVQPTGDDDAFGDGHLFQQHTPSGNTDEEPGYNALLTYALVLECHLSTTGMSLHVGYDPHVLDDEHVRQIAKQFDHILHQVCLKENQEKSLGEISTVSSEDLDQIWKWNADALQVVETPAHELFAELALRQPDASAVCAWDGDLTYGQLDDLSTRLAHHLIERGIGPNTTVPLCFEKSMWTPIAMMAVMRTGATSVAVDVSQPEERLHTIIQQVSPTIILASEMSEGLATQLGEGKCPIVVVSNKRMLLCPLRPGITFPQINPASPLAIIFTSGSTGKPKGVILTYSNVATAMKHHVKAFHIGVDSRVYDFASYSFDFAWSNLLLPLSVGGCVCVPSEEQRKNDLGQSINAMAATFVFLTTSVARVLDPSRLQLLRTIAIGGEASQKADFESSHPTLVVFICEKGDGSLSQTIHNIDIQATIEGRLAVKLPGYMVPTAYVPLDILPMTVTGKADRRKLREIGSSLTLEQLTRPKSSVRQSRLPETDTQRWIHDAWATILGRDPSTIGIDDHFFRAGGDSIHCMRLVLSAREQAYDLKVVDIFRHPILADLARHCENLNAETRTSDPLPFVSLDVDDVDSFIGMKISPLVQEQYSKISNVLPVSNFQAACIESALQPDYSGWFHFYLDFPESVDTERLRNSCLQLTKHFDILRTVFVRLDAKLLQVVLEGLSPSIDFYETRDVTIESLFEQFCVETMKHPAVLGTSFLRFIFLRASNNSFRLVLQLSHAQYDGLSLPPIMDALTAFYNGQSLPKARSFSNYIVHTKSQSQSNGSRNFWRTLLYGSKMTILSRKKVLATLRQETSSIRLERTMPALQSRNGATPATIFTASCAIMLGQIAGVNDVVFGRLVSGRAGLSPDLQDLVGPCINTVPVRVRFHSKLAIDDTLLATLQQQVIDATPYDTASFHDIARHCTDWDEAASTFQVTTHFRNIDESPGAEIAGSTHQLGYFDRKDLPPDFKGIDIGAVPVHGGMNLVVVANSRYWDFETISQVQDVFCDVLSLFLEA